MLRQGIHWNRENCAFALDVVDTDLKIEDPIRMRNRLRARERETVTDSATSGCRSRIDMKMALMV